MFKFYLQFFIKIYILIDFIMPLLLVFFIFLIFQIFFVWVFLRFLFLHYLHQYRLNRKAIFLLCNHFLHLHCHRKLYFFFVFSFSFLNICSNNYSSIRCHCCCFDKLVGIFFFFVEVFLVIFLLLFDHNPVVYCYNLLMFDFLFLNFDFPSKEFRILFLLS